MSDYLMEVKLINNTPDPDKTCATAALSCRSEKTPSVIIEDIDEENIAGVLRYTIGHGHHSVVEHANFTFSISGVSRALTHQLVRHRIASYSQQSQRAVKLDEPTYVTPHTINSDAEALNSYDRFMAETWDFYVRLVDSGVPEEDARYVLPNATTSNIVVTMNARELIHFFSLRCCITAQWEIRQMANRMLRDVKRVAPIIFENAGPPCDNCPEPDIDCELRR